MAFYLGLDASTQRLTTILIEVAGARRAVVGVQSIGYDEAFPEYGTRHGVLPSGDPLVAQSPPLMWVAALDRAMADVARTWPREMAHLSAVAGSAQQHGSVYLAPAAEIALASLDPAVPLARAIAPVLSRLVSPMWMDASTADECRAITASLGGDAAVARLTGSRAFERFTGPQIRTVRAARAGRVRRHQPDSPGQLVPGVSARGPIGAARSRRRVGDEPDGHRERAVVG